MRRRSRPAQLTGWVRHLVAAGCVLVGLFALYQVFFPLAQGNQVSLILFLAAVLPLTLLCYRSGLRLRRHEPRRHKHNGTTRRRSTGCSRWWRWRRASTRCCHSNSPTAVVDSTSS